VLSTPFEWLFSIFEVAMEEDWNGEEAQAVRHRGQHAGLGRVLPAVRPPRVIRTPTWSHNDDYRDPRTVVSQPAPRTPFFVQVSYEEAVRSVNY